MKFGIRTPSLKRRFAARTSLKRMVRAKIRMPKGGGFITNPKKAAYNAVYNRTSVSVDRLAHSAARAVSAGSISPSKSSKVWLWILGILLLPVIWPFLFLYVAYRIVKH